MAGDQELKIKNKIKNKNKKIETYCKTKQNKTNNKVTENEVFFLNQCKIYMSTFETDIKRSLLYGTAPGIDRLELTKNLFV